MSADAHQDLYARQFCGEGAPDWAVNVGKYSLPFPMPVLGTTVPSQPTPHMTSIYVNIISTIPCLILILLSLSRYSPKMRKATLPWIGV